MRAGWSNCRKTISKRVHSISRAMVLGRIEKTLLGAGLFGLGVVIMFLSPYAALRLSVVTRIPGYMAMYLCGFITLLYGTGQVLVANKLWGD